MPRLMPLKADGVASVMMKAEMPVPAMSRPLISPPASADRERRGTRRASGEAPDLHHAGEGDRGQAADRADGDVHLADGEGDHLREGDQQC